MSVVPASFQPSLNLGNIVDNNTLEQLSDSPILQSIHLNMDNLRKAVAEQKKQQQLPGHINHTDLHHFVLSYGTLGIGISLAIIWCWRHRTRGASLNVTGPTPAPRAIATTSV